MVAAIFLLALGMLVAGCVSLYYALNLVPTDFGFAYAQIGAIFIAASGVTLAIGFAIRALIRALGRLEARAALTPPVRDAAVRMDQVQQGIARPEPVRAEPSLAAVPERVVSQAPSMPMAGAAAAFGAGTAIALSNEDQSGQECRPAEPSGAPSGADSSVATAGHAAMPQPELPLPPPHSTESDLFGELDWLGPASAPVNAPRVDLEADRPEDKGQEESGPPEPVAAPASNGMEEDVATGGLQEVEPGAEGDYPTGPASREVDQVEMPPASEVEIMDEAPDRPTDVGPEAEMTQPPAGLIADADVDWLAAHDEPPLAPLETLEIVGSYDSAGTRFTMYSDGSVTASGTEGERRFRSLEELRHHLDRNLAASA
jgi:hypothetical protein